MVALSSRGNIAIVALLASGHGLDYKGCCVRQSHSCGSVIEPKLLWAVPQSGHLRPIRDPFSFLVHSSSVPTSFLQASVKPSCLIAVIACWARTLNCSGVTHDRVDTHNSTFPGRVCFYNIGNIVYCLLEFLLDRDVWDSWIILSATYLALSRLKSIQDCLAQHHFLGLFRGGSQ